MDKELELWQPSSVLLEHLKPSIFDDDENEQLVPDRESARWGTTLAP